MTPAEKAKQLYLKYYGIPLYVKTVKECCHIAVDEIINLINTKTRDKTYELVPYWDEVKQEIDKL